MASRVPAISKKKFLTHSDVMLCSAYKFAQQHLKGKNVLGFPNLFFDKNPRSENAIWKTKFFDLPDPHIFPIHPYLPPQALGLGWFLD